MRGEAAEGGRRGFAAADAGDCARRRPAGAPLSPAGRGTTEAFALAFEPGAGPGTTPTGDGSPNRNRIAARALYDGSGNAIMDNGAPRAAQDVEYDLDGNAVRLPGKLRQTVGASWDALGRMTTFVEGDPKTELGAPAETYRYAADGFRWLRAGADGKATLTLRDAQGRPLAEYVVARGAAGPTLSREYVHALGQVVAERTWTGGTQTTTYHHRDHLGSLRVATDGAGALADAHDYYPFGGEMGPVASSSRKKFTGHERDEETGLDYMLARYYPASMGRFLSVDPGFDVHQRNAQSWNLYGYVGNNPVAAVDLDGDASVAVFNLFQGTEAPADIAQRWADVKRSAEAKGHTVTIYSGTAATVDAIGTAMSTKDMNVVIVGHSVGRLHGPQGVKLFGNVGIGNPMVAVVDGERAMESTGVISSAFSLSVFSCNSVNLDTDYFGPVDLRDVTASSPATTFTGVDSGRDTQTNSFTLESAAIAFVSAATSTPASAPVDLQHAAAAAQAAIAGSGKPMDQGDKVIQKPMP